MRLTARVSQKRRRIGISTAVCPPTSINPPNALLWLNTPQISTSPSAGPAAERRVSLPRRHRQRRRTTRPIHRKCSRRPPPRVYTRFAQVAGAPFYESSQNPPATIRGRPEADRREKDVAVVHIDPPVTFLSSD